MKRKKSLKEIERRLSANETEEIYCFCASLETRFKDRTIKRYGTELTRRIEFQYCLDCKEGYLPGQPILQMEEDIKAKVLSLAAERFEFPNKCLSLRYYDEQNLMLIKFSNDKIVRSEDDIPKGLVYNFDNKGEIVSVEALDFYGKFSGS